MAVRTSGRPSVADMYRYALQPAENVPATTKASQIASTAREGGPDLRGTRRIWGIARCRFEKARFSAAKGYVRARSARVRRNRSSIQEVGAVPEAVGSKRNLSAQATTGRNRSWS